MSTPAPPLATDSRTDLLGGGVGNVDGLDRAERVAFFQAGGTVGSLDPTGAVHVTACGVMGFPGVIFLFVRQSASYISSWSLALSGVARELEELMSMSSATSMVWYTVVSSSNLYDKNFLELGVSLVIVIF
jgi:hypothetical protein